MAAPSRTATRALRTQLARELVRSAAPVAQKRGLSLAARAAIVAPKIPNYTQQRGIKTIDFAGTPEVVYGEQFLIN